MISFGFILFFLGKQSSDAEGCILSLQSVSTSFTYIQMESLKLIRTASALGRVTKGCCKTHPSVRLNTLVTQCSQLDKLGFGFMYHCTKTNSMLC